MTLVVGDEELALAFRSGDVPVFATPRLLGLVEEATVAAIRDHLESGTTTVGVRAELDHTAATGKGATVTAEATLAFIDGRKLTFEVSARDARATIASGRITRMVVDRGRFLAKI